MNQARGWRGIPLLQAQPLLLALAVVALGATALAGCGQTGPLTLPGAAGPSAGAGAGQSASPSGEQDQSENENEDGEEQ